MKKADLKARVETLERALDVQRERNDKAEQKYRERTLDLARRGILDLRHIGSLMAQMELAADLPEDVIGDKWASAFAPLKWKLTLSGLDPELKSAITNGMIGQNRDTPAGRPKFRQE